MNEEDIIRKRDELIKKIRNSDLYLEYKKVDQELYDDKELIELNKKKEELIFQYTHAQEEDKEAILISLNDIQKEINKLPKVINYYELRKKLKELVEPINEEILNKLV